MEQRPLTNDEIRKLVWRPGSPTLAAFYFGLFIGMIPGGLSAVVAIGALGAGYHGGDAWVLVCWPLIAVGGAVAFGALCAAIAFVLTRIWPDTGSNREGVLEAGGRAPGFIRSPERDSPGGRPTTLSSGPFDTKPAPGN
jgi:hypothetical protein